MELKIQTETVSWLGASNRTIIVNESASVVKTEIRPQIINLDQLPIPDRTLIDYSKYHAYVGHAGVKHSVAIQATRGCPYTCFYCDIYKTSPVHRRRSAETIFDEVKMLSDIGIKRFEFIDDIFNVHKKDFMRFFELILKNNLNLSFYFPTGLKGDLLNKDMIDIMVEAGSIGINLSLEHAAKRMQEVMRKRLNVDILRDNLEYISQKHPHVMLTLNAMHGFPTETQEEAMQTLEFIMGIKWIDFPYLHNVRVFPGTELERFALESGVSREDIEQSQDMSYHQTAPTMPFDPKFTFDIRLRFLKDYVLNRNRLLHILPYQLQEFDEDELSQRYNSYFPGNRIKTLDDLLKLVKIDRSEIKPDNAFNEERVRVTEITTKLENIFPRKNKKNGSLRIMLLDLSTYFTNETTTGEYDVLEPPFGLMVLLTYINREFGDRIDGKIFKSRIDFDNMDDLGKIVEEFRPDVIGIRAMTFYKELFQDVTSYLRKQNIAVPIIAGGPHPTGSYNDVLEDGNVDIAVLSEGEITFSRIIEIILSKDEELLDQNILREIKGIAFSRLNNRIKNTIET
jgi:radical SAM superfamily enzyme YgiQ (UPF0313 family)